VDADDLLDGDEVVSVMGQELVESRAPGEWFSLWRRRQRSGRILDCVVLAERSPMHALLLDGIGELARCLQLVEGEDRGAEHAGAAVIFGVREEPDAELALAAVRGFVLSAAQELGLRLRLNLVVHREGEDDLEPTLDYLADPLSAYVHAATLIVGDVQA
jgi:hypothetical protein